MKAVDLIPADERRASGGAGRSGGAAYVLLGALAVLVVMVSWLTITSGKVSDKRSELARVERDAASAEARANALEEYSAFASLSRNRVTTVKQLADSRFDWSHVMHEVARTIPSGITLTSLKGSVAGTAGDGAAATAIATTGPSVTLSGCAKGDQEATARMMVSLRRVDGVSDVSLTSSAKATTGGAPSSTGTTTSSACSGPTFEIVTTFGATK